VQITNLQNAYPIVWICPLFQILDPFKKAHLPTQPTTVYIVLYINILRLWFPDVIT
jgi:hypothetical protein